MSKRHSFQRMILCAAAIFFCQTGVLCADDTQDLKKEVEQLREQNRLMQQQLDKQQQMIDQLTQKLSNFPAPGFGQNASSAEAAHSDANPPVDSLPKLDAFSVGNVKLSGEGGLGFFESGKNGYYPNAQFQVDEMRLFLDAPLWKDVYLFGELNLRTREAADDGFHLGELYVDFEDLVSWGDEDHWLNVRAGQLDIPFGEEYQVRYAIDNPLISHSLSDLWGYSTGVEVYGSAHKFSYALAAQSGGFTLINDNQADKSIAGRVSYDPSPWWHFSASGMRTGDVSATQDFITALWFDNGFFKSIGSKRTSLFHADLAELDAQYKWHTGWLKAAGGYADYNDNDPLADNHRDIYYYYTELRQGITDKLYGAVRFSQIDAAKGYPLVANTDTFGIPTKEIWRLGMGVGYRFNPHLTLKAEYMLEHGQQADGASRNHEDLFAIEAAFKF